MTTTIAYSSQVNFNQLQTLLMSRRYSENFTQVPTNNIGDELKAQFGYIFSYVGEQMPDSFLAVKSVNGIFNRLYTPAVYKVTAEQAANSVYAQQNTLPAELAGVRFGKELIVPLRAFISAEGDNIEIGEGNTLQVLLPETETFPEGLLVEFNLFLADYQNAPKAIDLKRALKKDALHTLLAEPKTGGGFAKLNELGENTEHTVVGYDSKETEWGTKYSVILESGVRVSCNKAVEQVLKASPVINASKPATLVIGTIETLKSGKQKVNAVLETAADAFQECGGISLDW